MNLIDQEIVRRVRLMLPAYKVIHARATKQKGTQ